MLKLLIVDDEVEIRRGIENSISWKEYDIHICGEASNGREALAKVQELEPDIILMDIRMPVVSGLEVIEKVRSSGSNKQPKFIILSGYDDFQYAQKALQFGASDYLLKPCRPENILTSVLKLKEIILNELDQAAFHQRIKTQFHQTLPIVKEKYISSLISGDNNVSKTLLENPDLFFIRLSECDYKVAVLRIDDLSSNLNTLWKEDHEVAKLALKNICQDIMNSYMLNVEIVEHVDSVVIVFSNVVLISDADFNLILNNIRDTYCNRLGGTITIGVGNTYKSLEKIYLSFNEAVRCLEASYFEGKNQIYYYTEMNSYIKADYFYPMKEERELLNAVCLGEIDEALKECELFFSSACSCSKNKSNLVKVCEALIFSIYHLCIEKNVNTDETIGKDFSIFENFETISNKDQLKGKLQQIVKRVAEIISNRKNGNIVIDLAIKFIKENYYKDLSLEIVARGVFITPSYLSVLFKQKTNVYFVDYLHNIRIEKACELLKSKKLKAYEISLKVGYNDEKYFYQIFKKIKGITPTQYRESIL